MKPLLAALLGLALLGGCIPLPLVLPPTRLDLGGGGVVGSDVVVPPKGTATTFEGRATIHPLQMLASQRERWADAGVGWGLQYHRGRLLHGPVMQFEVFPQPASAEIEKGGQMRFGVHSAWDLSFDPAQPGVGFGFSAGASIAWLGFETGATPHGDWDPIDGGFIGYSVGETSVGFFGEINLRHHGGLTQGALIFGITFRGPATAGLLLVPLIDLCL